MIRHTHGNEFFLFTQHDHALLSGLLAEHLDGRLIAPPPPAVIQGIALHDCGWPLHDDQPTLNAAGEPLHVFETPPHISTRVWSASARRSANKDPYSGLLVSLHVLNLSIMSQPSHHSPRDIFDLNKFQHAQIELQERLRLQLGLRIDQPLTHGLADPGTSPAEDALLFDFRLLRALDALSLALLCSEPLTISMEGLQASAGAPAINIHVDRRREFAVHLDRQLFDASSFELSVHFRRVPRRTYTQSSELQALYLGSPIEHLQVRVESD